MDAERLCISCGADLVGPFQPRITLAHPAPAEGPGQETKVSAIAWICPGCGLVHWYAGDQDLDKLMDMLPAVGVPAVPGSSYERRTQVLRMMRRVKRM